MLLPQALLGDLLSGQRSSELRPEKASFRAGKLHTEWHGETVSFKYLFFMWTIYQNVGDIRFSCFFKEVVWCWFHIQKSSVLWSGRLPFRRYKIDADDVTGIRHQPENGSVFPLYEDGCERCQAVFPLYEDSCVPSV